MRLFPGFESVFAPHFHFKFCKSLPQLSVFKKASGFIPNDGHDSVDLALWREKQGNGERDRYRMAVLVDGGYPQHIVGITRFSGRHRLLVAGPMPLPLSCRNDEIERMAKSLNRAKSKDS